MSDMSQHISSDRANWIGRSKALPIDTQAALRRGKIVRILKIALPIFALALVALIILWPQLVKRSTINVNFTKIEQTNDHFMMMNPRFAGVDGKDREFFITADSASQETKGADVISLEKMRAEMSMPSGEWYTLISKIGVYNQKQRHLTVSNGFSVYTDNGYEVHGEVGEADLKNSAVKSDQPVRGQGKEGLIYANRFHTEERGNRLFFSGGVRVVLYR